MGKSNVEEKQARHNKKEKNKLVIALYREHLALNDSVACNMLRCGNPCLVKVFDQLDCHTQKAENIINSNKGEL
jgi:hypothetical protein